MEKTHGLEDFINKAKVALDTIQTITWHRGKNIWRAKYKVDAVTHEIKFKNYSKTSSHFFIEIHRKEPQNNSLSQEQMIRQFSSASTTEKIITDFINEVNPEAILYVTQKACKKTSGTLHGFYKDFRRTHKYQYTVEKVNQLHFYMLFRNYDTSLKLSIRKIAENRERVIAQKNELDLFLVRDVSSDESGLPMKLWISIEGNGKYGPCVWVQRTYIHKMTPSDLFAVSISNDPEIKNWNKGEIKQSDLKKLFVWIKLNRNNLLKLWNIEFNTFDDCVKVLKKIKN